VVMNGKVLREELEARVRMVLDEYRGNEELLYAEGVGKIVDIFKEFVKRVVPVERDADNSPFSNRVLSFIEGWNFCRDEILRMIEEV